MTPYPPPPTSPPTPPPPPPTTTDEAWPQLPHGWWRWTAPQATFPVPFTVADGFLLVLWTIVAQVVVALPATLLLAFGTGELPEAGPALLTIAIVSQAVTLVTVLGYLRLRSRLSWRLFGPVRPQWSHVGWGALAGVVGFVVINLTLAVLVALLGDVEGPDQALLGEALAGGVATILVIIAAVVLAPILEEVVFRGVLFQGLRRRVGMWPAAIISSLAFGVIHVEVVGIEALPFVLPAVVLLSLAVVPTLGSPLRAGFGLVGLAALVAAVAVAGPGAVLYPAGLTALAMVFAWSFHRTGGLLVPIVGHAVFNAISVSLAILAEGLELPI